MNVTAPVGATPPEPVTVAVKMMLPPRAVTPLLVTTLVGVVVAPATLATPKESPDATKAPRARFRIKIRLMPARDFLSLLIVVLLEIFAGGFQS
jgi:hypothetical protein